MKLLFVIDMQNDFIDGVLGSPEAQAIVPKVVERIEQALNNNEVVILTKDTHHHDYLKTEEGKNLPIPHCILVTKGWELNKDIFKTIRRHNEVFHVSKNTFGECWDKYIFTYDDEQEEKEVSTFLNTIETKDIEEIEIIGLDTDFCVLANAFTLKSTFPNVHIKINAECCAGSTPDWHEKALDILEHCHFEIINREPIINKNPKEYLDK